MEGTKKGKGGRKRRGQRRRRRRRRKGAVELTEGASRVDSNPIEQGLYFIVLCVAEKITPDGNVQGKKKPSLYILLVSSQGMKYSQTHPLEKMQRTILSSQYPK